MGETPKSRQMIEEIATFVPLTCGNKSAIEPDHSEDPDNGHKWRMRQKREELMPDMPVFWMYASPSSLNKFTNIYVQVFAEQGLHW